MTEIQKIAAALRERKEKKAPSSKDFLSTGLTLLDLAIGGGLLKEHCYLFVGDSQAGKTWLLLQIMAEAAKNKHFDKYRLVHDNPERGALMDVPRYYGSKLAKRLEQPSKKGSSKTLEGFYRNVALIAKEDKPFIYGLDSEDALPPEQDLEDSTKEKGKGSMGMERPKLNSRKLRVAHNSLEGTGGMLIIIKQTRENVGWDAQFTPKTRSGGKALTFYASVEMWFSIRGKIKKTIRGKPRVIGSILKIHVKKNRVSGQDRAVEIPFYPSLGFDDVGANVDFLLSEGHWRTEKDGKVLYKGNGPATWMTREKIISKIEDENREQELRELVGKVWAEIEEACSVQRKRRYE